MKPAFIPQVLYDYNSRPLIVFSKGRTKYNVVEVETVIKLTKLDTLRGLRPAMLKGEPYPVRKAASFFLHHDHREITRNAKKVLKALVARPRPSTAAIPQTLETA